jgi:CTP:molybdopterin cytidylyltransferase MocA
VPSVINKSVFAIVLAAGSASRFGAVKQLATLNDMPLVRYAARLAIDTCGARSVLVAGHEWLAVSDACDPWPGYLVVNEQHRDGIGSSCEWDATHCRSARPGARPHRSTRQPISAGGAIAPGGALCRRFETK